MQLPGTTRIWSGGPKSVAVIASPGPALTTAHATGPCYAHVQGNPGLFFLRHPLKKRYCPGDRHVAFILDIEVHKRMQPDDRFCRITSMAVVGVQFFCGNGTEQDLPNR